MTLAALSHPANTALELLRRRPPGRIRQHGPAAFEGMRRAGRLAAAALDLVAERIGPGVSTNALDRLVHDFGRDHGALPATLLYRGYPKSICTSRNDVVCHGIPDDKPLREGDIVNVDATVILDGWHGDTSRMFLIGTVKPAAARLVDVTREALWRGIDAVRPGATFADIGHAIQSYAEGARCSVVRDFCGHGLGQLFHDEPNVLHYGAVNTPAHDQKNPVLRPGMLFTIEPMINLGRPGVKVSAKDGWTAKTRDGSLSAQFEHAVGVTPAGVEVFTLSPRDLDPRRPV